MDKEHLIGERKISDALNELKNLQKKHKEAATQTEALSTSVQEKQKELLQMLQDRKSTNTELVTSMKQAEKEMKSAKFICDQIREATNKLESRCNIIVEYFQLANSSSATSAEPTNKPQPTAALTKSLEGISVVQVSQPKQPKSPRKPSQHVQALNKVYVDDFDIDPDLDDLDSDHPPVKKGKTPETILNTENKGEEIISKWLPQGKKIGKLLYGTSHGPIRPDLFYRLCVDQGPTLVILKSKEGNIFGGFASVSWKLPFSAQDHFGDPVAIGRAPGCFLFTLINSQGLPPTKFPLKDKEEAIKKAMTADKRYIAVFGDNRYGYDLGLGPYATFDQPGSEVVPITSTFPTYYDDPTGVGKAIFADSAGENTLSALEIYQIIPSK